MHVRQQIVQAVMAALADLPLTGARVHFAPAYALMSLPALSVLWGDEDVVAVDSGDGTGPVETRSLAITVTGKAMDDLDAGAVLNDIAADVETAMNADEDLADLLMLLEYRGADLDFTGELQQPAGQVEMKFQATYRVKAGSPETVVP